jgi:hypothetical protein
MSDGSETDEVTPLEPKLRVSSAGADFIRERGGTLYVWTDTAGMLRSRTKPPSGDILVRWVDLTGGGVRIRLAPDIASIPRWRVDLRTFPWKRVEITASTMAQFDKGLDYISLIGP